MKRLEAVRLEGDSRRRTVVDLRHTIETKKAKPQSAKLEFQTEQLIKKMQHKENKLASMCFQTKISCLIFKCLSDKWCYHACLSQT